MKLLIGLSVVLNVFLIAAFAWFTVVGGRDQIVDQVLDLNRERLVSLWESIPVEPSEVVFLGDSIIQLGRWSEFFPEFRIRNLGVAGDTTGDVLDRLDLVTRGRPEMVFLLIGSNDLGAGSSLGDIEERYASILDRLATESAETRVFVQSVLPRSSVYHQRVLELNRRLLKLADERGLIYIDLYTSFVGDDGSLRDEYTNDELHLLGPAYVEWIRLLGPHLPAAQDQSSGTLFRKP